MPAAVEEQGRPQLVPLLEARLALLQEAPEGRQASAGPHHDDGGEWIAGQLKAGGSHKDGRPASMPGARQDGRLQDGRL